MFLLFYHLYPLIYFFPSILIFIYDIYFSFLTFLTHFSHLSLLFSYLFNPLFAPITLLLLFSLHNFFYFLHSFLHSCTSPVPILQFLSFFLLLSISHNSHFTILSSRLPFARFFSSILKSSFDLSSISFFSVSRSLLLKFIFLSFSLNPSHRSYVVSVSVSSSSLYYKSTLIIYNHVIVYMEMISRRDRAINIYSRMNCLDKFFEN